MRKKIPGMVMPMKDMETSRMDQGPCRPNPPVVVVVSGMLLNRRG